MEFIDHNVSMYYDHITSMSYVIMHTNYCNINGVYCPYIDILHLYKLTDLFKLIPTRFVYDQLNL